MRNSSPCCSLFIDLGPPTGPCRASPRGKAKANGRPDSFGQTDSCRPETRTEERERGRCKEKEGAGSGTGHGVAMMWQHWLSDFSCSRFSSKILSHSRGQPKQKGGQWRQRKRRDGERKRKPKWDRAGGRGGAETEARAKPRRASNGGQSAGRPNPRAVKERTLHCTLHSGLYTMQCAL